MIAPYDEIEVEMHIYERGVGATSIITTNSVDRSSIGSYFNAVQKALRTGDISDLEPFRDKKIIDSDGVTHEFETDLDALYDIEESNEEPEYFDIYVR